MVAAVKHKKWTLNQYHQMIYAGILTSDDQVELFNGEIIEVTPQKPIHTHRCRKIDQLIASKLGNRAEIRAQFPITLPLSHSEPEPDIVVAKGNIDTYEHKHPAPEDIYFMVEVANTTFQEVIAKRMPIYAMEGIREYWVVDIKGKKLHVFTVPGDNNYEMEEILFRDDTVSPQAFPDVQFLVKDLLG